MSRRYNRKPFKIFMSLILALTMALSMAGIAVAAATGAPGVALLSHDQWAGDADGNFDLNWTMWYGNNASSWKLFEKAGAGEFKEVYSETIADNSPAVQSAKKEIRGLTVAGTYTYYAELTNQFGSTNSKPISVIVGSPTGDIILQGIDVTATPVNQFTIAQTTVEIPINFLAAENPVFTVATNNKSVVECSIVGNTTLKVKGLKGGRASLKITETATKETRFVGIRIKNADGSIPGMPEYVSIGSVSEDKQTDLDFWRDFDTDYTNKRTDIRYIYINGGPTNGWRSWTTVDGDRARVFIKESIKLGMVPFFVFYNIPDSGESYAGDIAHIQSNAYMEGYYKDLKFLLDICKQEAGDEQVGLLFEPDFLGYMMQQSNKQPSEINASVTSAYSSGVLSASDPTFNNTVEGLVKSINYTVNKYYPQAYFGWQFNLWAYEGPGVTSKGILHATENIGMTEGLKAINNAAKLTTDYYMSAGIGSYGADFISIDKYGLDGGAMPGASADPASSVWLWNADIWTNYLSFVKTMNVSAKLPVVLWQIPVGHINTSQEANPYSGGLFPDHTGQDTKYEDSAPGYFLGDTFKPGSASRTNYFKTNAHNDPKVKSTGDTVTWDSHMQEAKDAGVVSVLFGAGVNSSTDGVGSPPSDDYWWITKVQKYYDKPVMLDGSIVNPIQTVATPSFSVPSGKYTTAQNVTVTSSTAGATIRFTLDGTEPTASSQICNTAIYLNANYTLKAKAFKAGMNDSATATATYTIGTTPIETVATPSFSVASGTYTSAQNVTISTSTTGATIRYTTDGSEPTVNSPVYSTAIKVSKTTTLKAKAFKAGMNDSATASATYTIEEVVPVQTVATPSFSLASGTYKTEQNVTISTATAGATIRYTTNGTEPVVTSPEYTGAIKVSKTTTLKAKAFKAGMNDSATSSATYTIEVISGGTDSGKPTGAPATPQLAHNNWDGNASYTITFNIWWGNNATSYKLYENGVVVDSGSLSANSPNGQSKVFNIANKANGSYAYKIDLINSFGTTTSSVATVNVTKGGSVTPIETVSAPSFSLASGTYKVAQNVSISTATAGATIRYTTNGTEPTSSSAMYSGAVKVSATTTLKAKAFKAGMNDSSTSTATYTIEDVIIPVETVATPSLSLATGTYKTPQNVTISTTTTGATIRYTTNGTEPNSSSIIYSGAITVSSTTTLKAKAFKAGMNDSSIVTAVYTIEEDNTNPTVKPWAAYSPYVKGDIVSYSGKNYECRQPHTALPGWEPANVASLWLVYTGTVVTPVETVAIPSFSLASGTYTSAQNVAISTATSGATIRYTTNGAEPTSASAIYTGAITVSSTTTLKAKAFKVGMNDSSTATATYTVPGIVVPVETVATPSFSVASGTYTSAQNVSISTATTGATIRYTTNGSEPTASSLIYSSAIKVSSTTTLKAKAFKAGMTDSSSITATYTIGDDTTPVTGLQKRLLIGYWHTWGGGPSGGVPFVKLRDVDPNWDVINISFAEPVSAGSSTGKMQFNISGLTADYTINDFKADVKLLQSKGKKVVLSIGGYEGFFSLTSASAVNQFVSDIKGFVNEYGFDGIDIDLEQSSVTLETGVDADVNNPKSAKVVNMISAVRQICDSYGKDFILSWAPETFYMQLGYQFYAGSNAYCDKRSGVYLPMINALRDKTTYVHVQLYNSIAVKGLDGKTYSMGSAESAVAMCEMLLQGFAVGGDANNFFQPLRPDQVAIGVPSSAGAAGSGHISNAALQQAFTTLNAKYGNLRGIMTWSINWDVLQNNNSFAISNGKYLDSLN